MTTEADDTLLAAAKAGDRAALSKLLAQYEGPIYRFGTALCGDPERAKDVLQETLLAMARGLPDFRGGSSLSTWAYTIARRFCIKARRKRRHAPELVSLEGTDADDDRPAVDAPAPDPQPDQALAERRIGAAVQEAIARLEPAQREVLVLRDVEGLSASEVAEVLDLSVQAVKSRLHRARLTVRETLAPLLDPSPLAPPGPSACPDLLAALSHHLEGDLDTRACEAMEKHLEGCARCRASCSSLKRSLALCRTTPSAEVPRAIQDAVRRAVRELA